MIRDLDHLSLIHLKIPNTLRKLPFHLRTIRTTIRIQTVIIYHSRRNGSRSNNNNSSSVRMQDMIITRIYSQVWWDHLIINNSKFMSARIISISSSNSTCSSSHSLIFRTYSSHMPIALKLSRLSLQILTCPTWLTWIMPTTLNIITNSRW